MLRPFLLSSGRMAKGGKWAEREKHPPCEVSSESLFGSLHSAPQSLPEAAASAHSSSAESESTSDSDSSSDSESESSSSDSEENEPRETPAPEVPCPPQEAERQPKMAAFCPVGPESAVGQHWPWTECFWPWGSSLLLPCWVESAISVYFLPDIWP